MTGTPLLLLDVDGPLNPYAAPERPPGYSTYLVTGLDIGLLRVWLNPAHGERLLRLPYDLVWATTWMHEANSVVGERVLGLPVLPVIEWKAMHQEDPDGLYWKTRQIAEWAAGRPFAWVDDEISELDEEWIAESYDGEALLHWVDPRTGLTEADFAALEDWAAGLDAPRRRPSVG
ncbi:HAD domain-containing protein [Streptomyces sp. NPDC051940]|uniref:HAD domain-containing protein n=1 Tax=Streptomyces sp. NPDC051940 TaxID=3155675 RepID=UPI00341BB5A1